MITFMPIKRKELKRIKKSTMEKIQELTDKLYREGVEKGNVEAQKIVEQAKNDAAKIVADAKVEADKIIAAAQKKASDMDTNTKAELKMYTGQALSALKSEAANIITDELVKNAVGEWSGNKDYMGEFIVTLAKKWSVDEPLTIEAADAEALTKYFKSKAKELLDKGVKIEKVNGKSTSFTISPADGAYKVNFGEDEFVAYFKEFLRPQLVEMLF